jgi:general secretion pathway protein L
MTVINIQSGFSIFEVFFDKMRWKYEPFAELAAKKRTEVLVLKDGYQLFRTSDLGTALTNLDSTPISDLQSICKALTPSQETVLSIDQELCFKHELEVPSAAALKIDAIVNYEIERVMPFTADQIFLGWYRASPHEMNDKIKIAILVIRKEIINPIVAAMKQSGINPIAITVRDSENPAFSIALTLDGKAFEASLFKSWLKGLGLALSTVVIAGLVISATVWNHQSDQESLVALQTSKFEQDATSVRKQIESLNLHNTSISTLQNRKRLLLNRVSIIEELSKLLPDDTYLDSLSVEALSVRIDGSSPNPESLIQILENSNLFQNVVFVSPSFRNPGDAKSHFSIKLQLEQKGKT